MNMLFFDIKNGERFHWKDHIYTKVSNSRAEPYTFTGEPIPFSQNIIVQKHYERHYEEYGDIRYGQDEFGKFFAYTSPMAELPVMRVESNQSAEHAVLVLANSLTARLRHINNAISMATSKDF